ncbi:PX domain-containing protein [Metarhizium album ARSEF 1941]|uniref:PX domain-containing protein n=1 Tax=Metarhizium album (strain ARSEF 1941) TaxID=1081103 RepID=A0A0B2WLF2_METAS|nr:PX domain-containing protein [Metarhizium album ARSEF 1941]KHN96896.1 PX domain-containing protein [Metarhizium album ARSEF 1941]
MGSTTSDGVTQPAAPWESTPEHEAQKPETATIDGRDDLVKTDEVDKSYTARRSVARASTSEPTDLEDKASALAAKALSFISEATPATLGGVAIAASAIIYAILGRIGLLLIGAIAGVLVFISLENKYPDVIAQAVRGEKGPEVLDRVWLDLKQCRRDDCTQEGDEEETAFRSFDDFRPETRDALGGLVDAIIRDYVKWWYSPIIPGDHSFPLSCRKTLNSYLLSVSNRICKKRPADAFLDLLTNSSSIVIALLSELAAAFADVPPETNMTAADAVYNYLASHSDSRLANLLNQKQQATKFRMVAEDLLGFLDQGSQNCDPARIFLREVLANSVLETTLQTCSKAEWINGWIVYLLEAGEPDINHAIDVGMQTGRDNGTNVFADMDGNVGNVGIAKPVAARPSLEMDRSRRKESLGHKKKLSRADEELEGAMEGVQRMNAIMSRRDERQQRDDASLDMTDKPSHSVEWRSENQRSPGKPEEPVSRASGEKSSPRGTSTDSTKSEAQNTPVTPRSGIESASQQSSPQRSSEQPFTSFDQIIPPGQSEDNEEDGPRKAPLSLHNASFTLHDDATGDGSKIRSKPSWDYLIQVEPSSSTHTGWMIVRRYSDFQTLHEILRRIATISGATAFTELHKELPSWKMHTRESLRGELERYLRDGCWYQSLAESEGMKRFLEKSQGHTHGNPKSFGWETVGKNMLDVLNIAPKGAVEGGKTLVGGVSGVFGNIAGLTRKSTSQSVDLTQSVNRLSISTPPRADPARSPARSDRGSLDSQRSSVISTQPGKMAPMSRRPSYQSVGEIDAETGRTGRPAERNEVGPGLGSGRPSLEHSRASSLAALRSPSTASLDLAKLPPPPDEMTSDYESSLNGEETQTRQGDGASTHQTIRGLPTSSSAPSLSTLGGGGGRRTATKPAKQYSHMSEQETRVAVELLFAVINEMYTLSSAWNIRRTLLTAAKSFLLRPGNPSLLTVQSLIQSSVLDANTSDAGIAAQLRKLRENTLPTEQERAAWPEEMTADEKERLAIKARRLLIQSGVPAALMGVMGQAATGEALGRVFDCLQIEEVARGLIFGLMLQAVRILTH